ncbi:MAG: DUF1343 domain-containing protein [Rikenellaceae bacterium]
MKRIALTVVALFGTISLLSAQIKLGIDVLQQNNFREIAGRRVGLITNPTGVNRNLVSTIDILSGADAQKAGVQLTALFAPEHGVRGDIEAGVKVENVRDSRSGAMIYSLYGNGYKPQKSMLTDVDVLIFDIQDIGSRSYTFISTLGLAMEAAAENQIPFVVLDRPNPLGGDKIEGIITEQGFSSFVSKYPIPYIHGMTIGELAQLYNQEGMLRNGVKCDLTVIPMEGWQRSMDWEDTGLEWVATSPHIPQAKTSIYYPITGVAGELQTINIGVGYTLPFEIFGATWIEDADALADHLNAMNVPGTIFRATHVRPYYGSGKGKTIHGVQVHITNARIAPLTLILYYFMSAIDELYDRNLFSGATPERISMFDKVSGSSRMREAYLSQGLDGVIPIWLEDISTFREQRKPYLLY